MRILSVGGSGETKKFRAQMHEKMADYKEKQHKEFVSNMKTKLAENTKMTDDEKAAFLARIEQQYKTGREYDQKQFDESQKVLDSMSKSGISKEQKAALQKEFAAKMKAMTEEQKTKQSEEGKAFREKMKADAKARAAQKKAAAK